MKDKYIDCKTQADLALYYAFELGWPIFPIYEVDENNICSCSKGVNCKSAGKHPRTIRGVKGATKNINMVTEWWKKFPDANIGLATGEKSQLIVLDVDPRNGGDDSLEQLEEEIGKLPNTIRSHTGGGGLHIFFRFSEETSAIMNKTNFRAGLDLKTSGGYVVLPKSNHISGSAYEWDSEFHPEDISSVSIPNDLKNILLSSKKKIIQNEVNMKEGGRNSFLASEAGKLYSNNLKLPDVIKELQKINTLKCIPPLNDEEVITIAKSIERYDNSEICWEEPTNLNLNLSDNSKEFPRNALPESLSNAAIEIARFSKVPVESPAIVGLSTIAVAIGKKAKVVEKEGLEHNPALFFMLIAGSGERKSDVFKNMTKPLNKWEKESIPNYENKVIEVETNNEVTHVIIEELKKKAKKLNDNIFEKKIVINKIKEAKEEVLKYPPQPKLFSSDITSQNLFQKMHDRMGTFAVMSGEGREIAESLMGKYESSGTGDTIYLSGISGDKITRDRVGKETEESKVIHDPCLNVCIFIQPDLYFKILSNQTLRSSGAIARIWAILLKSHVGHRLEQKNEVGLDHSQVTDYESRIDLILNKKLKIDGSHEVIPHKASLSAKAKEARRQWFNQIEKMQGNNQEYEDVRDIASKAISTTCKIALLIHVFNMPDILDEEYSEISLDVWNQAQKISEFSLHESITLIRNVADNNDFIKAQKLLHWLNEKKINKFKISEIINFVPRAIRKTQTLKEMCRTLKNELWLHEVTSTNKKASIYFVNPKIADIASLAIGDTQNEK